MIYNWMKHLGFQPTVDEIIKFLWDHTKSKPLQGKYGKLSEYRFKLLVAHSGPPIPLGAAIPATKSFFLYLAKGKNGELVRRNPPMLLCPLCQPGMQEFSGLCQCPLLW